MKPHGGWLVGGDSVQHVVGTLIQIVLIRSSPNLVRSCIWMISRSSSNMGHPGWKTRSQDYLVHFKHSPRCGDSNSNSFNWSSPNLIRSCIWMISWSSSNMGHAVSKTRSQGHLVHFKHSAHCPDSNSNSVNQIFTKPGQKLYLDDI